jgi:hypothetical protein
MDPIYVPIVVAVIALIGVVFATVWGNRQKVLAIKAELQYQEATEALRKAESAARAAAESVAERSSEQYGYKARSVSIVLEVINLDGDVRVTKTYIGVKILTGMTLSHLPHKASVASPTGVLAGPTILRRKEADAGGPFTKGLSLQYKPEGPQLAAEIVVIDGSLDSTDPPLTYELQYNARNAILMWREQVEEAYRGDSFQKEYHSFLPSFPTDRLDMEVRFPDGYACEFFAAVFLSSEEFIHQQETARVRPGLSRVDHGARLSVEKPLIGFRYAIYWESPPQPASLAHQAPTSASPGVPALGGQADS